MLGGLCDDGQGGIVGQNDGPAVGGNPYSEILGIATAIVSTMSWQDTLNVIAERIGRVLFAWSASINSYDAEQRAVTYQAYWCEGGATQEDLDYIGTVNLIDNEPDFMKIIDGRSLMESHVDDPDLPTAERNTMVKWGLKTTLDGPLVYQGEVIGTIGVAETRFVRRFTPAEISLFSQLCELSAIGVHNARASRTHEQTEACFTTLDELGDELMRATSGDDVRAAVVAAAVQALETPSVALRPGPADPAAPLIQRSSDAGVGDDARAEMAAAGDGVRLLVPLSLRGESHGVLTAGWPDEKRRISDAELRVARIIAAQAALGLASAGEI
jgi:GAF domain-containing protein